MLSHILETQSHNKVEHDAVDKKRLGSLPEAFLYL